MSTGSIRNPLHVIIDLLILYQRAFEQVHQAGTDEARREALDEWRRCHPLVWGNRSSRNDTVRTLADPAKAWLTRANSRYVEGQDFNLVEECAHALSAFGISSSPMAMPDVYSKSHNTEEELWQRWTEQGDRIGKLGSLIARLRELAARAGEAWAPTSPLQQGPSTAPNGNRTSDLQTPRRVTKPLGQADRPDLVVVTVNKHETRAVLNAFETATGSEAVSVAIEDRVYHDLGTLNDTRVFHALSEMGSGGAGAMQQTVDKVIRLLEPGSVIAVGIAFGVNDEEQAIGDILLSKQLRLYEMQRVGKSRKIVPRGSRPDASPRLTSYFGGFVQTKWKGAPVKSGVLLTGEKLIDDLGFRRQLVAFDPEAIGGEMEGAGLYVSGYDQKVDWIVIKAICDFADGNKGEDKDARQALAAANAAQFLVEALRYAPLKRLR